MKICKDCKVEKPLSDYYADKSGKDNFRSNCKTCVKAKLKVNYQKKRSIKLQIQRNWYTNNAEKSKEYSRLWRKNNPDKVKQYHTDYSNKNKEKESLRFREKSSRRRLQIKNNGVYKISPKDLKRLVTQPCFHCSKTENQTLDHIIPISRGGTHSVGNLQTLCLQCNLSKATKTMMEWRKHDESLGRA